MSSDKSLVIQVKKRIVYFTFYKDNNSVYSQNTYLVKEIRELLIIFNS
jgi:hypothetical protein